MANKQSQSRLPPSARKPAPPPPRKLPAVRSSTSVSTDLRSRARADAGKGSSARTEDNLIPLVYWLQPNSPQCAERNSAYIDGAKPGGILLRGPNVVIDGDLGAAFQPCSEVRTEWLEWLPNRGGFVGRHPQRPADAKSVVLKDKKNRVAWRTPSGNDLTESRYFVGYIGALDKDGNVVGRMAPFVVPFKGTGHTVARGLNSSIRDQFNFQYPDGNIPEGASHDPSWSHIYRLTTIYRENDEGQWFLPQAAPLREVESAEEYDRGQRLFMAFSAGEVRASVDDATEEETAADETM